MFRSRGARVAVGVLMVVGLLAGCRDAPVVVHNYDRAPVPAVPDHTVAITADMVAADGTLHTPMPDGQYWATMKSATEGLTPTFTFVVSQALFGPSCVAALGADKCLDDYGVVADPNGVLMVAAVDGQAISVVQPNRQNYAVFAPELANLVRGGHPDIKAPAGFAYAPFPYLLNVQSGVVDTIQQIWVP